MQGPRHDSSPGWVRICRDPEALRVETKGGPVLGPHEVWRILRARAAQDDQEALYAIALDVRMRPKGVHQVSRGTLSSTPVHAREVFRAAVLLGADCLVIAHNHPAGTLRPSNADREVTVRLKEAGQILGIPLVDHVIVTDRGYYSMAEHDQF